MATSGACRLHSGREAPFTVERADGPWARAAACTATGPRQVNEDSFVLLCDGTLEGQANVRVAGLRAEPVVSVGLFDDLPETVAGPSLPERCETHEGCLFAVLDGHGGEQAARLCAQRLAHEVVEQLEASGRSSLEERRLAAEGTCLALDRLLRVKLGPKEGARCGTTCVFCLAWPDGPEHFSLLVTNLGDSRALVLTHNGTRLMAATQDHSPNEPKERARIEAAGGKVTTHVEGPLTLHRIDCGMGCSRALGDFDYKADAALVPEKQKVSAMPDVHEFRARAGDVVVLACDGVFDVLSSEDVAGVVAVALEDDGDPADAAVAVVTAALAKPLQSDNVTCVVAQLGATFGSFGPEAPSKKQRLSETFV